MNKRILLVEDEESLINVIQLNLELEGYSVETVSDGNKALSSFDRHDLVLLDVMLPGLNGFDVCKEIRKISTVPIVIMSAKGTSADRINGLKLGADDYIVKPFDLEELLLRIQIQLDRNQGPKSPDIFEFDQFQIDFDKYEIIGTEGKKAISKRESELLRLLTLNAEKVVSRDQILDSVWGKDQFPTSRTIDNYILNFRKYFESDPKNPRYFKSLRGIGYKFTTKF